MDDLRAVTGEPPTAAGSSVATATGRSRGRRGWARPPWRPLPGGVGLAVVLTLLNLLTVPAMESFQTVDRDVDALGAALLVLAGAATALRRRWPVETLVLVAGSTATYLLVGYPYGPVMVCLAVAVYSLARRRPLPAAGAWSGAALVVMSAHLLTNDAALPGLAGLAPVTAWVAVPFSLGLARRLVGESLARERSETQRRVVDEERLRLAQEVHDIVGHGLAAIQMQADVARHLRDTKPEQAQVALEAISRASADALAELRTTLAAISPAGAEEPAANRAPTPSLSLVEELCRRVEDAGVAVDLSVRGQPRPLPTAVDVAAYRVLQESLTNVVKHSSHPRAVVEVAYLPQEVSVTVSNQDLIGSSVVEGFGISGMRRRVEHLGGNLTAGTARRRGQFQVEATIPIR